MGRFPWIFRKASITMFCRSQITSCRQVSLLKLATLLFCFGQFAVGSAGQEAPEEQLREKGLKKAGAMYVLSDESKLSQMMGQTTKIKRQVIDAGKSLMQAERQAVAKKQTLAQLRVQHVERSARLANVRNIEENNRLVGELNAIAGQIELGTQDQTVENNLRQARARASELRESYAQHVIDMRSLYDSIRDKYDLLAADPVTKQAILEINKTAEKKVELGPSRTIDSIDRQLTKIEETVLSEEIVATIGDGNLLYVNAVFNGSESIEIAVDTGASSVVLPWSVAERIGLKPGPDAPRAIFVMADGRESEGRIVKAKSVRVGKFIVEDVECAVLGPENINAVPLLGQTFLGNFIYKIDSARAIISITRVEDGVAARGGSPRSQK